MGSNLFELTAATVVVIAINNNNCNNNNGQYNTIESTERTIGTHGPWVSLLLLLLFLDAFTNYHRSQLTTILPTAAHSLSVYLF